MCGRRVPVCGRVQVGQKVCVRERERARAEKSTNGRVVMRMTVESKDKWTSLFTPPQSW